MIFKYWLLGVWSSFEKTHASSLLVTLNIKTKTTSTITSGPVVKNQPSNAGDSGSIPGRGTKIPHAEGQLSLSAATTEPTRSGARVPQLERRPHAPMKDPTCRN